MFDCEILLKYFFQAIQIRCLVTRRNTIFQQNIKYTQTRVTELYRKWFGFEIKRLMLTFEFK